MRNYKISLSLCSSQNPLRKKVNQSLCLKITKNGETWPEVIKLFSCSTKLSMKFIMLINVKMPTIGGILTFISIINATSESLKARKVLIFQHFSFYGKLKFHAQLS